MILASTISGNQADHGSAVYGEPGPTNYLDVWTTTITENSTTGASGGAIEGDATFGLTNTIVANQATGSNCTNLGTLGGEYNLLSDPSCGLLPGDFNVQAPDALLGPLADNGGPTLTHLPAPTSPAIDVGFNDQCHPLLGVPETDQRGEPRPVDGGSGTARCDIGSVERQSDDPAPLEITTSALPDAQVGVAYSETLAATGGAGGNEWSIIAGTLPGLTLTSSGVLTGEPTAAGGFNFTVRVEDDAGATATKSFNLQVVAPALQITTTSLPDGDVGQAYTETLTATGGVGGNEWSIISGTLPNLTLTATGVLTGEPTMAGVYNFTVQVEDDAGVTDTQALSITIDPAPLDVTTTLLSDGQVGVSYNRPLAATGGVTPYSWSLATGSTLPTGLTVTGGAITGTPEVHGTFNFTVQVEDDTGATATQPLSLTIHSAPLDVTTTTLADAQVGVAYSQSLTATGGVTPYSWTVASGALPAGLSLTGGTISGTPESYGTFNFTLQVEDDAGVTDTQALSIKVAPAPLEVTTSALPDGQVGVGYSESLAATGGVGGNEWSVTSGALPNGLSLSAASGAISGTPESYGTFNFTVQVEDDAGVTDTQALSIAIDPAPLEVTTSTLADGQVGVAYSQSLTATGGVTPYSWTVASGALPAGLSLTGGTISGTPELYGTFNFTVRVADSASPTVNDTQALSITIIPAPLVVTTTALSGGQVGVAYNQPLEATGGVTPYSWAVTAGDLPPGLSLTGGTISGTPELYGTFDFTVQVADSASPTVNDTQALSITIIPAPLVVGTATLSDGQVGVGYSESLTATGGVTPYTWSVTAGSLPAGLTLTGDTIAGTPEAHGTFEFTVQVADSASPTVLDTQELSITVRPPVEVATATLPEGEAEVFFTTTLAATGGLPPYSWALEAGSVLPADLTLDGSTGVLSGTPTVSGAFAFTVLVTDAATGTDTQTLSLTLHPAVEVTTTSLPEARVGTPYSQALALTGGVGPYAWAVTPALPDGLSLDATTGEISGNPTSAGTANFTVTVTDGLAGTDDQELSLLVKPPRPWSPTEDGELTDTGLTVEVEDLEEVEAAAGEETCVRSFSARGSIEVCAPADALPAGHTLVAGAIANLDALLDEAPAPSDADLVVSFVVQLQGRGGDVVDRSFEAPLTVHLTVDGDLVPDGAASVRLAYWDGEAWATILAEVTERPDGTVDLVGEVDHLTIFGALDTCAVLEPEPAASGVSLARWCGGSVDLLPPAESFWVTVGGRFYSYVPAGPAFVNTSFLGVYPEGVVPDGTVLLVVR